MSRKTRRTVIALAALVTLSLPLVAHARPSRQDQQDRQETRTERFFAQLWERLTAPFAVFRSGATAGTTPPPPPQDDNTDGRSILDPLG